MAKIRLRTTSLCNQLKDSTTVALRATIAKRKALRDLYKERETRRTLQAYTKSLAWGINQCLCRDMKLEASLKWVTANQESVCDAADRFLKRTIQGVDNHCQHTLDRVGTPLVDRAPWGGGKSKSGTREMEVECHYYYYYLIKSGKVTRW